MSTPLAGFLNVLKPPGMTSHDVVDNVRRKLPRKTKVGHLGTLDPAATGVLPLAIGAATRLIPLLPNLGSRMKAYLAEIELGVSTSTDDLEGELLGRTSFTHLETWDGAQWDQHLAPYRGEISQVPPQVSAVRKDGQRAYDRVRQGETVELAARIVTVDRCEFQAWDGTQGRLRLFLVCSTGTYVRSIARDLGASLGVGGALAFLIRTHSGPFTLETAITLEELMVAGVEPHLLAESYPFLKLPRTDVRLLEKGREVPGEFQPDQLYLAANGLLLGQSPGRARVEAVFD